MTTKRISFDTFSDWFANLLEHVHSTYMSNPETPDITAAYKDILFEMGRLILSTDHDGAALIHRSHIREPFDSYLKYIRKFRDTLEKFGPSMTTIHKEILVGYIDQMLDPIMFYNIAKEKRVEFMENIPVSHRRRNTRKARTNRNTVAAEYVSEDDEFRSSVMKKQKTKTNTRKSRTNRNTIAAEYASDDDEFRKEVMLKASTRTK